MIRRDRAHDVEERIAMQNLMVWLGQFLLAALTMFAILVALDLAGGASFAASWPLSAAYALAAAAVFTATRYSRSRRP